MTITIRRRTGADLPSLAAVLKRVYDSDGYPVEGVADPTAWLSNHREIRSWVVVDDSEPVGQISLVRASADDDAARIWTAVTGGSLEELAIPSRLFVAPDHRGGGAGRMLMEQVVRYAQDRKLSIAFDVMLKDRAAIRLYEKLGAQRLGETTHFYGNAQAEPAVVYALPL